MGVSVISRTLRSAPHHGAILASTLVLAAFPQVAHAERVTADDQEIVVSGRNEGYRGVETTSGTKTATPFLDVPQSIAVVTAQQLADQQIRSMSDLVRLVPGVSAGQGEGHRDQITLRGNNSTADFFVDGLRDDVQYFRSFYNVDRVEVHKGPNAMIFGRGGGGGLVNRVTKSAITDQTLIAGAASLDSFASGYAAVDLNVPFGPAALRVNGFFERLDNHRDAFEGDRYAVNPLLGAVFGPVRVEAGYEYVRDNRVVDRGIPSARTGALGNPAGPARGLRDAFFGDETINQTDFTGHAVRLRGSAELTPTLTLTGQALIGNYDKSYRNALAVTAIGGTAAAPTVGIEAYSDLLQRETRIGQANLIWRGDTGLLSHAVLVGGEYTSQDTYSERINGFFNATALTSANRLRIVPLTDPLVVPPIFFVAGPAGNSNRAVDSNIEQASVYVQDQIGIGDAIDVIGGLRYDRFDAAIINRFTGAVTERTDDLWSPRAGLVVKPHRQASFYLSYSRSYLPQTGDQFISLDATGATLNPERFDNYELGAKLDLRPGLSLTTAVYRLDRTNSRSPGPIAGTIVQSGEQRSSGFEAGLNGRLTPRWQIAAGYAYTHARITETTASAPAGRAVPQVPRNQISLWNRFQVTDKLGLGMGAYHQSSQFATLSNITRLSGYIRFDAAAFLALTPRINAQLNIENVTDEGYFPSAHNDNNISTGAPLNVRFTLNAKF